MQASGGLFRALGGGPYGQWGHPIRRCRRGESAWRALRLEKVQEILSPGASMPAGGPLVCGALRKGSNDPIPAEDAIDIIRQPISDCISRARPTE